MALLALGNTPRPDLGVLLDALGPAADLVQRDLRLIALSDRIRGVEWSPDKAAALVGLLLDVLEARPQTAERLPDWWQALTSSVDGSALLSEYGFGSRNAFVGELVERLFRRLLPATPETADACEFFALAMPGDTLRRLALLLSAPADAEFDAGSYTPRAVSYWQDTLLQAITSCTRQIRAAGMENAAHQFRIQLDAFRHAAASVYTHLDAHGISMDLVFRLRQLRGRVIRVPFFWAA
jgi:site-specific recombinase